MSIQLQKNKKSLKNQTDYKKKKKNETQFAVKSDKQLFLN